MKSLVFKKNIIKGICAVAFCTNETEGRTLCSTCRKRKCRIEDPEKYAWQCLCDNARRRNIFCTITLEQFRDMCSKVEYIGFSGRSAESYTLDRRYNDIGYHIDNIRIRKKGENTKKYFYYDYRMKTVIWQHSEEIKKLMQEVEEDLPF
jgi:hypothetical protein